ncbi:MAG: ferredoxin [Candidatus Parcubacteria bacterium]|nr:ferredoxin [Candidatus Parcubacteria bacterium]
MGKIEIVKEKCLGCGLCVGLCPEVFELKENKSSVKDNIDVEKNEINVKNAKESCPAQAINILE